MVSLSVEKQVNGYVPWPQGGREQSLELFGFIAASSERFIEETVEVGQRVERLVDVEVCHFEIVER